MNSNKICIGNSHFTSEFIFLPGEYCPYHTSTQWGRQKREQKDKNNMSFLVIIHKITLTWHYNLRNVA